MRLHGSVRTTKQIAFTASALGYVDQIAGGIHGPEVDILYVDNEDVRKAVREKVDQLIDLGLISEEILLISIAEDSFWLSGELSGVTQEFGHSKLKKIVNYSAANDVKGIESVAVILVGVNELQSAWARQQSYIASTRASTYLSIILPKDLKISIDDAYFALAERHSPRSK
jgi:hypothetical protein